MAIEGAGHAPMSSVRRSFSSVMLCMATSVFVSSTGSSSENRVFGLTFPPPSDTLLSSSLAFARSSEDFNTRLPGGIWLGSFSSPMICLWISSPGVGDLTFSLSSAILFSEKLRDVERAPPVTAEGTTPPVISPAFASD